VHGIILIPIKAMQRDKFFLSSVFFTVGLSGMMEEEEEHND